MSLGAFKKSTSGELRRPLLKASHQILMVGIFSVFVNLLMLVGPLYMMQVYDRVLGSKSEATLIALTAIIVFLYVMMGMLDTVRGRVMSRIGARFQQELDARVFDADLSRSTAGARSITGVRDLEIVQKMISSPVLMAIFDLPWTPVFLAGIAIFHPWLGILALGGGGFLIAMTLLNRFTSTTLSAKQAQTMQQSSRLADQFHAQSETVTALGMAKSARDEWMSHRDKSLGHQLKMSDRQGGFLAATKVSRLFLQSAMLGLGAYLVLQGELSAGAMIAGSILLGRSLQPVEQIIGQWQFIQQARRSWDNLKELLATTAVDVPRTALPRPDASLLVSQLTLVCPGEKAPALRAVSFNMHPGQALGVIGVSGSGKSTLARALTGVWKPVGGKISLGGANIEHYDPDVLGSLIGYLPQHVQLFDGTITQNIARLSPNIDPEGVISAAKQASAHDMILSLPEGYDTVLSATSSKLSGGQMQRIGLARALYGDPVMLILDEPNSNLDHEGNLALNHAIKNMKSAGGIVLVMAHRPAAIQECDLLLMLEQGKVATFGPRDAVLQAVTQNHQPKPAGEPQ